MILSICPNPSIDCTIEVESLNVGKLNRIENKVETYSGKAMNVAIGIARLNGNSVVTGFMFENHKRMFDAKLDAEGVFHEFVVNNGSTRVNYKIIDKKAMLTEINDKGEEVSVDKQKELIEMVKRISRNCDIAVISGSLPKGVEPDFYAKLINVIPDNVKIIVDTEKDNMISAIATGRVYMAKPNLKELEDFSNMAVWTKSDMIEASKKYLDLGAKNVLLSLGADGAVLTDGENSYYCKSASVAVNSTVGAGDSMISAVCVGLEQGVSYTELLKRAVAAGTAAVTTSGTNLFYKEKYDEIYAKLSVEKIN